MQRFLAVLLLVTLALPACATEEDRTTGKAGVDANIVDNSSGAITPEIVRTELKDLWDSAVLQDELETLVDPIIDAAITGSGGTDEYLYTPTDGTCTTDMSAEFEAFLTAHDGIVVQKAGTCIRLDDGGASGSYVFEGSTDIIWRCQTEGQCQAGNTNSNNTIKYYVPDGVALDSKTLITAVENEPTAAINKDDVLPYVEVASVSGYSVGDIAKIADSVPLPNRISSTKTITDVSWDGTKCVVTTSASHGYTDSHFVGIKGVTGSGTIDIIDGSDGYGRVYNITKLSDTTFSLQTLDNSTGSTSGTTFDCSSGAYSSGGQTFRQATWASEDVKIVGVDAIQNRIYFSHPLAFGELYVQSPVLYRYTEARKVDIRGIEFVSIGDTSDLSISVSDAAVDIIGVPRAVFEDIKCYDNWDACLILRSTPHARLRNIKSNLLRNRGTSDPSASTKSITDISVATQAVFTSASHGYSNGTVIILTGMPAGWTALDNIGCVISDQATNTFKCKDTYGNYFNTSSYSAFSGTGTSSEAADVTGLGYTVSLNSGQMGTVLDGIYTEEGRHGVTTDGSALSWKATLSSTDSQVARFGVPTYYLVQNGRCSTGNGVCWDEHEESYRGIWRNLTCDHPVRGPDFGSYKGFCGQFRGDGSVIDNLLVVGGQKGIRFPATDWFRDKQFTIGNIQCRDMSTLQSSVKIADKCLEAGNSESGSYTSYTYKAKFDIDNMTTFGVSLPIWMDKRVEVNVNTLNASDYDDMVYCQAGATFRANTVISSHADPQVNVGTWTHKTDIDSNGFNIVNMASDGTYNGCTAYIGNVINTQGTGSNYLEDVFETLDATATKNWYLGSYTEHDPSSVNAARITESTSGFTQIATSRTALVENPTIVANDNAYAYIKPDAADNGSTLVLTGEGSSQGVEIDGDDDGAEEFRFRPDIFRFTPEDSTSASTRFQVTPFADTSIATGEAQIGKFGTGVTVTHDVGNYTNQREWLFYPRTHAYDGASTIDIAATVYIDDAPIAGTNATFTDRYALWVNDGYTRLDNGVTLTTTTIGALGTPPAGTLRVVSDAASGTDCTTGSGSTYNLCVYNGSAWVDM